MKRRIGLPEIIGGGIPWLIVQWIEWDIRRIERRTRAIEALIADLEARRG